MHLGQIPIQIRFFPMEFYNEVAQFYMRNPLCLHPDCDFNGSVWEDGLIEIADLLVRYAEYSLISWDTTWNVREKLGISDLLCDCIGNGLISFLNMQAVKRKEEALAEDPNQQTSCPRRLVRKTPNVNNLELFFKLFPNAHLLIIIRDGRSVVESGVRSFHWNYETKMRA